ncbi:MAG: DNA polymerase III subunit delta [Thiotrichales bacterium]
MKLAAHQIHSHLTRDLAPVYLVSGDEPLQRMESADAIRDAARAKGYTERVVFDGEHGARWDAFIAESSALSLFAERKILEVRLSGGKLDRDGELALTRYLERPSPDNVLLMTCGRLDKKAQASGWVTALERAGVWIPVWELDPGQTVDFVAARLTRSGFQVERTAVRLIAERVEGNLLAAAQEVEKLALLYSPGPLSIEQVQMAVADSARYDAFEWVDAALAGDVTRLMRILRGLRGEGVPETLILWATSRDLRLLAQYLSLQESGGDAEPVLRGLFGKRRDLVMRATRRHDSRFWCGLLRQAADIDFLIKGLRQGNVWDELLQLGLAIAGRPVLTRVEPLA